MCQLVLYLHGLVTASTYAKRAQLVKSRNHSYTDELERTLLRTKSATTWVQRLSVEICGKATHFTTVLLK